MELSSKLSNRNVAVVVANGFEESEFAKPIEALKKVGAMVDVISLEKGKVKSWNNKNWGKEYDVDLTIDEAIADEYDALVLPGGVMNPDQLRTNKKVVEFVTAFLTAGKPIGAICHGPWTLIETGKLKGITITSWPSLKTDLTNAGANWIDKEVVEDQRIISSRKPADLPAFCEKLVDEIAKGTPATTVS